jgi:long-chain acyl-CoA synthetase
MTMQLPDLSALDTTAKLLLHNAAHWGADVALREKEYGIWNRYSWADSCAQVQALALGLMARDLGRGDVVRRSGGWASPSGWRCRAASHSSPG